MSIAERLSAIQQRIEVATAAAGRAPGSVRLVAVSKTKPFQDIEQAVEAGQRVFGENYAQELRDKHLLAPELEWHFIGALQRNKVKYVVNKSTLIHGVDSLRLGRAIGDRAVAPQPILVSVNMGEEASKSGVPYAHALELCAQLHELPGLSLRGLMCIPPRETGPWFERLAQLATLGRDQGLPLAELSMGMSADFEQAIAQGATLVRVGSSIFGERSR